MDRTGSADQVSTDPDTVGPPDGPEVAAFFDFDGTLIDGYSAGVMYRDRLWNADIGLDELRVIWSASQEKPISEESFELLLSTAAQGWAGRPSSEFEQWGEQMARSDIYARLYYAAWQRVQAHKRRGHTVVVASSATRFQIAPIAREIGIDHILSTELEVDADGALTGRIAGRTGWGDGKVALVERFAAEHGIDLQKSWAYANGDEDVAFLSLVGRPHAVNPQPVLAEVAAEHDWPVLEFTRPSASSWDPRPWLRTAALYGSFLLSSGVGVAHGLITGDRRAGVDLATALIGPLGQAIGSIDVEVTGEEHVWSHRPAVFVINHQSAMIDLVVTTRLLRGGITALAKKEVRDTPVIGWLLEQADFAFVDRGGPGAAAILDDAARRLREGTSVIVAPEGTRSLTPSLGPFKSGAFRLAAEVGVPVVPVVIRNAGELMWRDANSAYPGTVQVHVHPPIPTDGWTADDIETATETVRALFVDTLEDWPLHDRIEPAGP